MKFDFNPSNPAQNEFGGLCDIYEERQSGEDGNGLLVESGCAWRKLNVQHTLDESTKNHFKMQSEEAEHKLKSQKAIVLEPGNPSMKALAAAEECILPLRPATLRKNYNKKKEAARPKKSKLETLQVGCPSKSTYKPGLSRTTATMNTDRHSSLSFPLDQSAASSSPLGAVKIFKGIEDDVPSQKIGKQDTNTCVSNKEILTGTNNAMRNTQESKGKNIAEALNLQSILISLLMNKPDGMTLKALEKAVKGVVPNLKKKINPIVRKIASYKYPGRYILLPGVDWESFKKPLTESGSSPDDNHPQLSAHKNFVMKHQLQRE